MVTITLDEQLKALASAEATRRGYASVDDYVADLIRGDAGRTDSDLEAKLVSRLDQGNSVEMTAEDWNWIRQQAAGRGILGAADHLQRLVEAMRKAEHLDAEQEQDFGSPESCTFRSDAELETMLQAGLDSGPAMEMTEQDWKDIRREVAERTSQRQGT